MALKAPRSSLDLRSTKNVVDGHEVHQGHLTDGDPAKLLGGLGTQDKITWVMCGCICV